MKTTFGFFSFTEVTDPAEHRSYNEWHQLDHLPEQFPLPGIVVRAALGVDAGVPGRAVSEPALDPIHYVTCYLMAEPIAQTLDDFFALGAELHRLDRFHRHRRAHLTGPFGSTTSRPRPPCSSRPRRCPSARIAVSTWSSRSLAATLERRISALAPFRPRARAPRRAGRRGHLDVRHESGADVAAMDGRARTGSRCAGSTRIRSTSRRVRAARGRASRPVRRGVARDVRRTVRDDHAVGVGLVRSGVTGVTGAPYSRGSAYAVTGEGGRSSRAARGACLFRQVRRWLGATRIARVAARRRRPQPTTPALPDVTPTAADFVNINTMARRRPLRRQPQRPSRRRGVASRAPSRRAASIRFFGTMIQLIPTEAMVKRHKGYSPATGDWEFFQLSLSPSGTVISSTRARKVKNFLGAIVRRASRRGDALRLRVRDEPRLRADPADAERSSHDPAGRSAPERS